MKLVDISVYALVLAILPTGYFKSEANAVTLTGAVSFFDDGSPSSFTESFSTPYVSGPFNAVVASVGGTLTDTTGDGASVSGTLAAQVNAVTVLTIPINCSIGAGSVGALASCPSGGSAATTKSSSISTGSLVDVERRISFGLSGGGDAAIFLATLALSGGGFGIFPVTVIDIGAPSTFDLSFTGTFLGPRHSVSVGLLGAFMDLSGDGASITNLLDRTFINSIEVAALQTTGNCSAGPGAPQAITSCLGDVPFVLPSLSNFLSPATGTLSLDLALNLSGGFDSLALISSVSLLNVQAVPEPASMALTLLGLGVFGLVKRSQRRR